MDLEYTIIRSAKRRKLTITVERDRRVIVHAPEGATDEKIHRVVESKRQWIFEKIRHPQKYQDLPHPPGKELVSGESALYLGREYRIEMVKTGLSQIRFAQRFFIPATAGGTTSRGFARLVYRQGQRKDHPTRAASRPRTWRRCCRSQDRRQPLPLGLLHLKDNVNFNWRLIKAPMFVIDYVIVHELAHLIEPNHTPRFWNIVRAQAPTMEKAKAWLKEHGELLEQAI